MKTYITAQKEPHIYIYTHTHTHTVETSHESAARPWILQPH